MMHQLQAVKNHFFNKLVEIPKSAQNEHEFTFLEAMKVHMTRFQSFCKLKMLKHSQIQVVVSQMFQKMTVPFFINANGTLKFFSIKMISFKKWVWARKAHASAKRLPPFFGKKHFY